MILYIKCNTQLRKCEDQVIVYDLVRQNYKLFSKEGILLRDTTKYIYNHLAPLHLHTFFTLSNITWGEILRIEEE